VHLELLPVFLWLDNVGESGFDVLVVTILLLLFEECRDGIVILFQLGIRSAHLVVNAFRFRIEPGRSAVLDNCGLMISLRGKHHTPAKVSIGIIRVLRQHLREDGLCVANALFV